MSFVWIKGHEGDLNNHGSTGWPSGGTLVRLISTARPSRDRQAAEGARREGLAG